MYKELIHEETINGFECKLFVMPEDISPRDCFDSDSCNEVIENIENGLLTWVMVTMEVYKHGIKLGDASLGGICESSFQEITINYWDDLANDAIDEAKDNIKKLITLTK